MSRSALRTGVSAADFLAWEKSQAGRHEFFRGEIFAMAGGSPRHAALSARVARALGVALGRGCEVFSADLQLGVDDAHYVYADATVVCGPLKIKSGTSGIVENPSVVVDVLSESTEQYDRGLKWEGYRKMSSLTDYLLVSQRSATIEHYRREPDGSWHYSALDGRERVRLTGGGEIDVSAVSDGVFALAGD